MLRVHLVMRVLVGGATYLAPRLSAKLVGLNPARNRQGAYWARLFGIRDVVLGVGAERATESARKQVLLLAAVCDVSDVLSALMGRRAGYLSPVTAFLTGGLAATAAAVTTAARAEVDRRPRTSA